MDKRREYIINLQSYTDGIDKEVTLILQSLQWDKNHLLQQPVMVSCAYDSNHKIPPDKIDEHERQCFFRHNGYCRDENLLPDPPDTDSNTLVKLSKEDITQVIENASRSNPIFKKVKSNILQGWDKLSTFSVVGCDGAEPLSLARLQAVYSADERRAIHDAVVSAVPSCHDLADLALPGAGDESKGPVIMSRFEILAELRNMRRRRTKYRVAAKTRNYSDVLRDVIRTQMEHYNVVKSEPIDDVSISGPSTANTQTDRDGVRRDSFRNQPRIMPKLMNETAIKTKRHEFHERNRDSDLRQREYRNEDRRRDVERNRYQYDDQSRERHDKDRKRSRDQEHLGKHDKDYVPEERSREKRYDRYNEKRYDDDTNRYSINENSSSNLHRDLDKRVKREPGLDEDSDRRGRRRWSKERRYSNDSYQEYSHEGSDRSRDRRGENYEDRVKRGFGERRKNNKERSREARHTEYYEHRKRSAEQIYVKQEKEDSTTRQDDGSYEIIKRKRRKEEDRNKTKDKDGHGRHTANRSSSDKHREKSNEQYYVNEPEEDYNYIGSDERTYDRSKNSHKRKDKTRNRYSDGKHYDEPDGSDRHKEPLNKRHIKHEEESPSGAEIPIDKHRKKEKKHKKSKYKDIRDTEHPDRSGRHRERSKQNEESARDDNGRYYNLSKDYSRDQRHDRGSSYGSERSDYSCTSEEINRPRRGKRYYELGEAEYDPHKKIKVEK